MSETAFTKDNIEYYLRELAKEFRKRNGNKTPAEIILIGGASVLINYGFRENTYDLDAIIQDSSAMKESISSVEEKLGLQYGWLNTDFMRTASYTPKLVEHSKYYKTFSNILGIRTISGEYLLAMKLMSGRVYKNDLSDIAGILKEHKKRGNPISLDQIKHALEELYQGYEGLPEDSRSFLEDLFEQEDLEKFYEECRAQEVENKEILVEFQEKYPNKISGDNIRDIIKRAKKLKEESSNE